MSKRELLKELGVTDRLLKFWVGWYKIPVNRRGRGSTYPSRSVETLKLIKQLSDSRYFTMRFVRDFLRERDGTGTSLSGSSASSVASHLDLCRSLLGHAPSVRRFPPQVEPLAAAASREQRMGEDLL